MKTNNGQSFITTHRHQMMMMTKTTTTSDNKLLLQRMMIADKTTADDDYEKNKSKMSSVERTESGQLLSWELGKSDNMSRNLLTQQLTKTSQPQCNPSKS